MDPMPMDLGRKVTQGNRCAMRCFATHRGMIDFKVIEQIDLDLRTVWDTDQWT
jgi:hypothetical protein